MSKIKIIMRRILKLTKQINILLYRGYNCCDLFKRFTELQDHIIFIIYSSIKSIYNKVKTQNSIKPKQFILFPLHQIILFSLKYNLSCNVKSLHNLFSFHIFHIKYLIPSGKKQQSFNPIQYRMVQ